ncbi:putative membrane-bound spermidine synthase [Silvimonas terrae]|uniref:Putative membrane-bound spermidine synthase n=1 Tax=Silvimonas terrae TaxID=300266 RepID=A0A840REP9_9NEIS|nr:fused MFS/spermidine synthase [Silvimonas terrae]MBB5190731.1 putative membrane-bound spermidine synthase [Silvimonas terrae]
MSHRRKPAPPAPSPSATVRAAAATEKTKPKRSASVPWRQSALLFVSGAASLVYQVIWVKQLGLIVGVDVYAVTTAISAFFLGLALGGWWLGRWADRVAQPLQFYGTLEVAVAVSGLAGSLLLAHAAPWFAIAQDHIGLLAWLPLFLLIGLPAFFMGGTLPALLRDRAPADGRVGGTGGVLYAANTLGAIAGALIATFWLIPLLGLQGTILAAATLNVVLALGSFLLSGAPPTRAPAIIAPELAPARRAILLYAAAGGIALGYEVIWTQSVVQFMSTRTFAFTMVLVTYLFGIMLGSALYARHADRLRDPWGVFGGLIAAAGAVALLQVGLLGPWLPATQSKLASLVLDAGGGNLLALCLRFALAGGYMVLLPTVLLGAAFPVVLRLAANPAQVGRDTGKVLALNTAGGILGTALTGFVLIPLLGLVHALWVLALAACAVGLAAVWRGATPLSRKAVWAITLFALILGFVVPADRYVRLLARTRGGTLVQWEETAAGTVAVLEQGRGAQRFRRLYIQGVSNSGDTMASLRYMRLQALLPLIIHQGEPRSAMVIALGTGITAGALTQYPGLTHRVTAELLPAVVRAVPAFNGNFDVAHNPAMQIRVHDGRQELLRNPQKYDLITLEPPPPSAAGVVNLYSQDFYELARNRLQPGGLFAQWLPLATQNDEDSRALVRSFLNAFPYATLWTTELHEMLLVGSAQPIVLNAASINAHFAAPAVRKALTEVGIPSPAALLATWITDHAGLERYAAQALPVTDDHPRIEYADWLRPGEFARVLPQLLNVRSPLPLMGADADLLARIETQQQALMDFYAAGLYAYAGDKENWQITLERALQADPDNLYYRHFTP